MRIILSNILLLVCVYSAQAQQAQVDSLRNVLNTTSSDTAVVTTMAYMAFHMVSVNPDSARLIAQEALDYAVRINFDRGIASANNSFGWIYFNIGNLDKSIEHYTKALEYFRWSENELSQMAVLMNMSSAYIKMGSLAKAMDVLTEALPLTEKYPITSEASAIFKNLGIINRQDGRLDEAIKYFDRAYQLNIELGNQTLAADTKVSMNILYQNLGSFDEAAKALDEAERLFKSQNSLYGLTMVAENRGGMRFKQTRYLEALEFFKQAKEGFRQLGYTADIAYISLEISKTYDKLGRYAESIAVLDEAYELVVNSDFKNYIYDILNHKSNVYEQMGNPAEALKTKRLAFQAYVDYQNELETNRFNELKVQYETEQKDAEIALLNKDNELQVQRIQRQRLLILFIVSTILFVLTVIGVFIYRYRLKMQTKELEIRSRIAADLHDEVGSSVSSIRMLSEIALQHGKDDPSYLQNLLGKINDNAKDIVENTSDIVWMIKPGYDEIDAVIERMERYIHDMCSSRDIAYSINLDALRSIKLDMAQRKNLYLIFKEAVNNAVKYSGTKYLNANIQVDGRHIQMDIQDTGIGFDVENTSAGNGLDNMVNRAKELGGLLHIQSNPGKGTNIIASIPV
jgi:two-component system, NarL family, sensor histidine kinase UhpB